MATKEQGSTAKVGTHTTVATVKRALGISKTYVVIAIVISILALILWTPYNYSSLGSSNSTSNSTTANIITTAASALKSKPNSISGYALLAVPLDAIPTLMLATPVLLLFVYDKNNGVLEYMISLGLNSRDIYMRYLKALILMIGTFLIIFFLVNFILSYALHGLQITLELTPISLLSAGLALAVTSLMITAMMIFSSLQKTRAGSNQPFALLFGYACTAPAYLMAFLFSYSTGESLDILLIVILAIISVSLIASSRRLIKKEKLLP